MFERFVMFQQTKYKNTKYCSKYWKIFTKVKKIKQHENKYGEKSESENDEERVHFCIVS